MPAPGWLCLLSVRLIARVVELVDTQVSEACAERCSGSSPLPGTTFVRAFRGCRESRESEPVLNPVYWRKMLTRPRLAKPMPNAFKAVVGSVAKGWVQPRLGGDASPYRWFSSAQKTNGAVTFKGHRATPHLALTTRIPPPHRREDRESWSDHRSCCSCWQSCSAQTGADGFVSSG